MLKLMKILSTTSIISKLTPSGERIATRCIYDINFDSEEEITKNTFEKIMMIGINLPESKNLLTEASLEKLLNCIENFESNENFSAAILHGFGGNFCTGTVSSKEALMLSESLLQRLNELKKPIIGSLNGYSTNFGLYLAIMCDIRVMDSAGMIGFTNKSEDFECPSFVYERLLLSVGLSKTLELICTRSMWNTDYCLDANFISKAVKLGSALGQSIILAQSMGFHRPLDSLMNDRSKIFSLLKTKK